MDKIRKNEQQIQIRIFNIKESKDVDSTIDFNIRCNNSLINLTKPKKWRCPSKVSLIIPNPSSIPLNQINNCNSISFINPYKISGYFVIQLVRPLTVPQACYPPPPLPFIHIIINYYNIKDVNQHYYLRT